MFEEVQYRVVPAAAESIAQAAAPALWQSVGLALTPIGPGTFIATGAADSYGIQPELRIYVQPGPQGAQVQIAYAAKPTQTAIITGIVLFVLFWPALLLLAWLAYSEFVRRRTAIFPAVWQAIAPPALPPFR